MEPERIIYTEAGGRKLPLCYNLGACAEITERLGSQSAIFELFNESEHAEEKEVREAMGVPEPEKKGGNLMSVLPFIVACLARNGQKRLGIANDLVTEEWVKANVYPYEIENLTFAVCQALYAGIVMEHGGEGSGEVDVVQEQIEKN